MEEAKSLELETLKERMLFFRNKNDFRIPNNSYVIVMLDGKNFSKVIKRKYKLPFDDNFIKLMNDTAAYVCSKVQGAKFAYVQSDEISIFMSDADSNASTLYYDGRLVKLLSIIPAIATSYFNRHVLDDKLSAENLSVSEIKKIITEEPLYQFDCKVWTVPSLIEVQNWILFRQIDCIRNSKIQAAQTYLGHKKLLNKNSDEQIKLLNEEKNINWNIDYDDGKKFGRFIYKEKELHTKVLNGNKIEYERSVWKSHYAKDLTLPEVRDWFMKTLIEPYSFIEQDSIYTNVRLLENENKEYCERIMKNLSYLLDISMKLPKEYIEDFKKVINKNYTIIRRLKKQIEKRIGI